MIQARFASAAALVLLVGSVGYGAVLHMRDDGRDLYALAETDPFEPARIAPMAAAHGGTAEAPARSHAVLVGTEPFGPMLVRSTPGDARLLHAAVARTAPPAPGRDEADSGAGTRPGQPEGPAAAPADGMTDTMELAALPPADVPAGPAQPDERPGDSLVEHDVEVQSGDTLMAILTKLGIGSAEAHAAIATLSDLYDPRKLRAGQALQIATAGEDAADGGGQLTRLRIGLDLENEVQLVRADEGFEASEVERPVVREQVLAAAAIDDSLYVAGSRAGIPSETIVEFIRLFSWDVDFQRDIQPGSRFEMLFETLSDEHGEHTRGGAPLYAHLTLGDRDIETYRFELPDGRVDYFDRDGKSVRKFLMRTPVDGARLSSGFGMRKHPVLGYSRMHKGTDFAAPTGTPIYAAGSGTVVRASRYGSFGNYVLIRHNSQYDTAYAHMSKFARGMKPGVRVTQGQVIGYVGTTGRSTGPHLHYEVHQNGDAVNPMTVQQAFVDSLTGANLQAFRQQVETIDESRLRLAKQPAIAAGAEKREARMRTEPGHGRPGSST
ncbi:peptidoglycan DD-metalloendopeptidase family protein [Marinivivus vitaminiproducens]|uniref:peptidoglycan DD-metalloendopeptidase family protein n=1 Tax=Marinivivus vitaminiproducens TaxID=3035935 RepID=UPI002797FC31|nr:peptidoglycan DD-metalloendopeptidase family protein [Geminicoccaceae bacterium SCSIO 64248]